MFRDPLREDQACWLGDLSEEEKCKAIDIINDYVSWEGDPYEVRNNDEGTFTCVFWSDTSRGIWNYSHERYVETNLDESYEENPWISKPTYTINLDDIS